MIAETSPAAAGAGPATPDLPVLRIAPRAGWGGAQLREVWEARELLYFLAWRDIKVRYKQTIFGAAWAIIQPFVSMVVFTVIFGRLANMPSDGVPYPVFSYAALVPWTFFANSLSLASNSLVGNASLLQKVYFPRLVIPASSLVSSAVDFCIAFAVLLAMLVVFRVTPSAAILWLPCFALLAATTSLGAGLLLASLNVTYRDVRYAVPFLIQVWLFATPIVYPTTMVPAEWRVLYSLNPMVGVVEGFRWALLGTDVAILPVAVTSWGAALVLLITGYWSFRRMERAFADVV